MLKNKPPVVKDDESRAQEILIDEVTENLHNEQLKQVWDKYKYVLFGTIFAVILAVAGMEAFKANTMKTRLSESDTYEQAAVLNAQGQTDAALAKYASLEQGKTNYKYLAQMRRAGILFDEGKTEDGIALLKNLSQNTGAPEAIRAVAVLGLVSQQIESAPAEELQALLAPYLSPSNVWYGTAVEMSILILIRDGKMEQAQNLIKEALSVSSLPAAQRERLTIIQAAFEG